ncbi:hypothetical protein ACKKBF_B21775 [Auxenochlorella protothecoides x Auxenochlorella symbiontica]
MKPAVLLFTLALGSVTALDFGLPWASLRPSRSRSHREEAQITSMPGYPHTPFPSRHYGGYINVDASRGRRLFYYYVESEDDSSSTPLVLWLNGGPGCSSFDGFVKEHGPFKVSFKGRPDATGELKQDIRLDDNPFSWSKSAHMLYVDSPAGVGMSYSDTRQDYVTNDTATTADLHHFLRLWLQEYPEHRETPFYVAGESYAGVFVPLLVQAVLNGNQESGRAPINIKGYLVGNPVADTELDANSVPAYLASQSLISQAMYEAALKACDGGRFHGNPSRACSEAQDAMDAAVRDINHYDTLATCYHGRNPYMVGKGPEAMDAEPQMAGVRRSAHSAGRLAARLEQHMLGHTPRCLDQREMWAFCNDERVRHAMHAAPISHIGAFDECTNGDRIEYTSEHDSMLGVHAELVRRGMRALAYSGDHDMIIPHTSTEAWTAGLGLRLERGWAPWRADGGQVGGFAVHYRGLVYATVRGAGHAVPESRPREALALFTRFVRGRGAPA